MCLCLLVLVLVLALSRLVSSCLTCHVAFNDAPPPLFLPPFSPSFSITYELCIYRNVNCASFYLSLLYNVRIIYISERELRPSFYLSLLYNVRINVRTAEGRSSSAQQRRNGSGGTTGFWHQGIDRQTAGQTIRQRERERERIRQAAQDLLSRTSCRVLSRQH